MKKIFIFTSAWIPVILWVMSASAHFGMVIPSDSMVMQEDNRSVTLHLSFSHPFEMVGMGMVKPKAFGVVESVKAASDLYSPLTGTVVEINEQLMDEPELVNTDPYGDGWMLVIEVSEDGETVELFDAVAYEKLVAEEE